MKTKTCTKCNIQKEINEYYKKKECKNQIVGQCKECYKKRAKQWRRKNIVKSKETAIIYRKTNKEKIKINAKNYREINKNILKIKKAKWYNEHKEKINKRRREHRENNRNELREYGRKYYANNKDKYRKSIEKNKKRINQYMRNRRITDINFKIKDNLKRRTNMVLNGNSKSESTLELLGCKIDVLKKHIERKFTKKMNWNNYGRRGWHIDHIIPCAHFDLSKESEQRKCFHFTNLQPLWAKDNVAKRDKVIEGTQMTMII
ncbi:hypothetical protein LCGC14_0894780 [marine sediment metagenome]|uniref:Uncharacterized protein n=1 Tax=marine sediment metagenome TaxID=412755 RepID=A0A0F9S548_9ZZZZ